MQAYKKERFSGKEIFDGRGGQSKTYDYFISTVLGIGVVYHLHQKPIWFQTVQMERKNFDWKIPFGARAFHFPYDRKKPEIHRKGPGARWKTQKNVNGTK